MLLICFSGMFRNFISPHSFWSVSNCVICCREASDMLKTEGTDRAAELSKVLESILFFWCLYDSYLVHLLLLSDSHIWGWNFFFSPGSIGCGIHPGFGPFDYGQENGEVARILSAILFQCSWRIFTSPSCMITPSPDFSLFFLSIHTVVCLSYEVGLNVEDFLMTVLKPYVIFICCCFYLKYFYQTDFLIFSLNHN